MLDSLFYAACYSVVGIALLVLGFYALDLVTPGRLARHITTERSANAAVVVASSFVGLGAIIFTAIWTNADYGFDDQLGWTVAFGLLGIALQVLSFVVLDLVTPGKLSEIVTLREFHPATIVAAAIQLAVSMVVIASIA